MHASMGPNRHGSVGHSAVSHTHSHKAAKLCSSISFGTSPPDRPVKSRDGDPPALPKASGNAARDSSADRTEGAQSRPRDAHTTAARALHAHRHRRVPLSHTLCGASDRSMPGTEASVSLVDELALGRFFAAQEHAAKTPCMTACIPPLRWWSSFSVGGCRQWSVGGRRSFTPNLLTTMEIDGSCSDERVFSLRRSVGFRLRRSNAVFWRIASLPEGPANLLPILMDDICRCCKHLHSHLYMIRWTAESGLRELPTKLVKTLNGAMVSKPTQGNQGGQRRRRKNHRELSRSRATLRPLAEARG